ncbi:MAG: 30S ribosomal protein S12 methylthiotransferase RimO [Clostridiales Family XIII bacterium]|jgi:ribosomal protein S12 methylthiotransferase|nr:30S ribosomal protein S12 methylthiotransferase RimO [Clostridiales Family XIII bacterium]
MKIYIETLGCFKNQEDSERAAGLLLSDGLEVVQSTEEADILMINTCGFIEDAKRESIDRILQLAEKRQSGKKLIVTGCLAQRYGEELFEELPEADAILGVNDYKKLPEIVEKLYAEIQTEPMEKSSRFLSVNGETSLLTGKRTALSSRHYAYLKIAEGCSNCCSYCAIPSIRGGYRSVAMDDLLREAGALAAEGTKELILIAQDVTAWGIDIYGKYALPDLLSFLCRIEGIEWIRLLYCYEERITDELIRVMSGEKKILHYIDIPLQHCSDAVLARMNRSSTRKSMEKTLEKLRTAMPDIAIRTTLMTGFPGETEEDFAELVDFVETQCFDRMGVFAFSEEEGTAAFTMDEKIDPEIAKERRDSLMLRQMDISLRNNQAMIGKELLVFVEEQESPGVYIGRTYADAPEIDETTMFESSRHYKPGDFARVRITDAMDYDIIGVDLDGIPL